MSIIQQNIIKGFHLPVALLVSNLIQRMKIRLVLVGLNQIRGTILNAQEAVNPKLKVYSKDTHNLLKNSIDIDPSKICLAYKTITPML